MASKKSKSPRKKREKKEDVIFCPCSSKYNDIKDYGGWDDYNWILIPLIILILAAVGIFAILILALFIAAFVFASACFIVPAYLAAAYSHYWALLYIATIPIGISVLSCIYYLFSDDWNLDI